jgi:hypothetical protein
MHLDDTLKLEMLKNAVKGAPHLASVETNSDLYQRMGHSTMPMDFDGYFEVLSSAAENYDDKVGSTVRANTCHASMHSTSYDTFNNGPDVFYDVDNRCGYYHGKCTQYGPCVLLEWCPYPR